jgi:hypothetical protein
MKTAAKKSSDQVAEDFNNILIQICRDYFGDECPMLEVQTKLNPDSTPNLIVISATGKRIQFSEIVSEFEKNKAQAAEERRRRESMEEKQAIRLALMSRHTPLDKAKAKESKDSERKMLMDWHRKWGLDVVPLRLSVEQKEKR